MDIKATALQPAFGAAIRATDTFTPLSDLRNQLGLNETNSSLTVIGGGYTVLFTGPEHDKYQALTRTGGMDAAKGAAETVYSQAAMPTDTVADGQTPTYPRPTRELRQNDPLLAKKLAALDATVVA